MKAAQAQRVFFPILLIAAAACACTHHGQAETGTAAAGPHEVKVQVTSVGVDRDSGTHYVLLEDQSQQRALPIMIGDNEAQAMMLELHGLQAPRPLTHDLLRSVIEGTGNHVDRVVISDMRDDVFYAKIFLDHGKEPIDSRPSDAIALAMGTNAPIYVNDRLLGPRDAVRMGASALFPRSVRAAGVRVQELTREIALYFNVPPQSAVLVADTDPDAKRAGIHPGDLITKVDGKPVKVLDDFDHQIDEHKDGAPVIFTVKRGQSEQDISVTAEDSHRN